MKSCIKRNRKYWIVYNAVTDALYGKTGDLGPIIYRTKKRATMVARIANKRMLNSGCDYRYTVMKVAVSFDQ